MRSKSGNQYIRTADGCYYRKISARRSIRIEKVGCYWVAYYVKQVGNGNFYYGEKHFEKYLICLERTLTETIETAEKTIINDFYLFERV